MPHTDLAVAVVPFSSPLGEKMVVFVPGVLGRSRDHPGAPAQAAVDEASVGVQQPLGVIERDGDRQFQRGAALQPTRCWPLTRAREAQAPTDAVLLEARHQVLELDLGFVAGVVAARVELPGDLHLQRGAFVEPVLGLDRQAARRAETLNPGFDRPGAGLFIFVDGSSHRLVGPVIGLAHLGQTADGQRDEQRTTGAEHRGFHASSVAHSCR